MFFCLTFGVHIMCPGLIIGTHLLSPKGVVLPRRKTNARVVVPLLRSSINILTTTNPGLAPWALQECRPYRALLEQRLN